MLQSIWDDVKREFSYGNMVYPYYHSERHAVFVS